MRATMATVMMATALLAACSDKPGEKAGNIAATDAMSKAEVKAQVDRVQLKPGQWEGRFTIKDIDMPQMPEGAKVEMKRMMTRHVLRYCVTPEQAANPSGDMFSGQENRDCTYGDFAVADGKVKGQLSCRSDGGTMNAAMSGTYAPESYAIDMDMKMEGGPHAMAMTARSEGRWIAADCASQD
ncbi:DUF3617 domain-containing protein [Sphingobium amiense]|uniref:DUF3617 domain-containing protein n=1 Tax=Sphingobium amiense TaxID=135719 RepID=A0A494W7Y4_9SPHN|nr:DUF3617 domain-containing protein [Sphingobium amiense]BBD99258.1 DUF3617 domain-containing protein [Sphingobium amiense]